MLTEPKHIFLQVGSQTPDDADYTSLDGVTFHHRQIMGNDLQYTSVSGFLDFVRSLPLAAKDRDLIKGVFYGWKNEK